MLHFINDRPPLETGAKSVTCSKMKTATLTLTQNLQFGPAMTALPPMRRAFVVAWNNAGHRNAADCARAAGYSIDRDRQTAYDALHDPRVQAAIVEDLRARFTGMAGWAMEKLAGIAENDGHTKQYDALKTILVHGGVVEKQIISHEHNLAPGFEERMERMRELVLSMGDKAPADIRALVLDNTAADADYAEVTPEDF